MAIFRLPRFVRRFMRRYMAPIPEETAHRKKKKISIVYAIISWNLFGLLIYQFFSGGVKVKESNEKPWWEGRVLNMNNTAHYKVKGFNFVEVKKDTQDSPQNLEEEV